MSARSWFSFGKSFRVIGSKTGLRPAIRTKYGQVSTRSTFAKIGPFKLFFTHRRNRRH